MPTGGTESKVSNDLKRFQGKLGKSLWQDKLKKDLPIDLKNLLKAIEKITNKELNWQLNHLYKEKEGEEKKMTPN